MVSIATVIPFFKSDRLTSGDGKKHFVLHVTPKEVVTRG
jgi:hypothetical protein